MSQKFLSITSANFTRPADTTAYADGDLIANSTTAGSVSPLTFTVPKGYGNKIKIESITLRKTTTTETNSAFNLYLFTDSPTVSNGDNGALTVATGTPFAVIALTTTKNYGGSITHTSPLAIIHELANTTDKIYGLLEATAAYAPGNAEVFTVTIGLEHHL